jgi:hypothetical protein
MPIPDIQMPYTLQFVKRNKRNELNQFRRELFVLYQTGINHPNIAAILDVDRLTVYLFFNP